MMMMMMMTINEESRGFPYRCMSMRTVARTRPTYHRTEESRKNGGRIEETCWQFRKLCATLCIISYKKISEIDIYIKKLLSNTSHLFFHCKKMNFIRVYNFAVAPHVPYFVSPVWLCRLLTRLTDWLSLFEIGAARWPHVALLSWLCIKLGETVGLLQYIHATFCKNYCMIFSNGLSF